MEKPVVDRMSEDDIIEFLVEGNMVSDNYPFEYYLPIISSFPCWQMSSSSRLRHFRESRWLDVVIGISR